MRFWGKASNRNPVNEKAGFSKRGRAALMFALPQLLILLLFFYWPASQAVQSSFTLQSPFGGSTRFVGLMVFERLLTDPEYYRSIYITVTFVFLSTLISILLGLLFAVAADDALRGSKTYRTAIIWPYAVAAPVAATTFQFLFDPFTGLAAIVNNIWPGFWNPYIDGTNAFWMIVVVAAWQHISYNFLFILAGLRAIPNTLFEAAAVDGAGAFRRFYTITLPLLTPTFFFIVIMNIASNFTNSFGIVNVMTEGGPGGATNLMAYKIYADGFIGLNLSSSSAQSIILMLIMIAITVLQFRFVEHRINYKV